MPAIHTIVCYANLLPFELTEENIESFMVTIREAGVTHVQVNQVPELMHPELLNQPENVYLWFANHGPALDLFVSSKLNKGLWPEMYLERNRKALLRFAAAARRHGIKPLIYVCEPRFVPERFFQRHPTLRGPRVDNPVCSTTPLFAPCTDLPEVREHYREMMGKMMELVPDLEMATLFTSDSGAGFDYNPDQYAGANGAGFNRGIPLEKRVAGFLGVLLEAGCAVNPSFTVNLTSGFPPETRAKILEIAPQGVVGSVYGLYSWGGGLEEQWGYHQAVWGVPRAKWNIRNLDRVAARADRFADMKERFDVAAQGGREPIVHAELPSGDCPRPLRYTPQPFETVRVMKDIVKLGAKRISLWGVVNPQSLVPYDVNREAMKEINEKIEATPEEVVLGIAKRWVGQGLAEELVAAWRKCDHAWTHRPLWSHFGLSKEAWLGPLVPDLTVLRREEIAYYRTAGIDDLERIRGIGDFVPHEADERNRDFVIHELYEKQTLPDLCGAADALAAEAGKARGEASDVLQDQSDHIRASYLYMRSHYNWYEAGRYIVPSADPGRGRTMPEIIDDEISVTRQLVALIEGRVDKFFRVMSSDFMTYEFGPGLVDQMKQRIPVMESHRNDSPRNLSTQLAKVHNYLKELYGQ